MIRFRYMTRWTVVVLALVTLGLTGCSEDSTSPDNAPEIVSITASETSTTMGATITLIVVASDPNDDALNIEWSALSGTFSATDDDTVSWTAPETEGIVTIRVKVDDDAEITNGSVDVGVGVYVPTVQPYYVGESNCAPCHSTTHTDWTGTHHGDAFASVEDYGMDYCLACHTTGYDDAVDNGGYDEQPISQFENVQCESCHGPASGHLASTDKINDPQITVSMDEAVCQECHGGTHTTFWVDWAGSDHGSGSRVGQNGSYGGRSTCSRCHGSAGFLQYLEDGTAPSFDYAVDDVQVINCATCHNPHSAANEHQVREADSATMPDGTVVTAGGLGLLCMNCHTGRRDATDIEEQLDEGNSRGGGPHHGNQGGFINGTVVAREVASAGFAWAESFPRNIEHSCVTCHMEGEAGVNTGRAYEPSLEACEPCHGTLTDFDDVMAKNDYDGDGAVEGVQSEVSGLMDELFRTIVEDTGLDTTGTGDADPIDQLFGSVFDTNGAPRFAGLTGGLVARNLRAAAFNWAAVSYDHSHGVHNAAFAIQLLQQSIKHVNGTLAGKEYVAGGF